MFCKTCGSVMVPEINKYGRWLKCPKGHLQPELVDKQDISTSQKIREVKKIEIADSGNLLAVHDHKCKSCGYGKSQLIEMSCYYTDEDNIYQMKCGRCGFVEQLEGKVK